MSGLRLMAVHAHPDDESSKGAATMARYVDEGYEVLVVTLTGGERGSILNPAMDLPGVQERMAQIRRAEMADAVAVLGVRQVWLGFVDSGLPEGDPPPPLPEGCFALEPFDRVTEALVRVVRAFRPHVMTTYDNTGGYPHPDHIRCHEVSMAAFDVAGQADRYPHAGPAWEPLKIYYDHGFNFARFRAFKDEYTRIGEPFPMQQWYERFEEMALASGDTGSRITTRVECAEYFRKRDDALRAHATQIDPNGAFFSIPLDIQMRLWPWEEFELARSRVPVEVPETDLFAGIKDPELVIR